MPFKLTNENKTKFIIAGFERKVVEPHLKRIEKAISENKLFDNILTVLEEKNKYKIIDGQHRFLEFCSVLNGKEAKEIDIFLRIIKTEIPPEEIYLALDSGKQLSGYDILKVFDNGNNDFFNILRQFCSHYPTEKTITFYSCLAGVFYAKHEIPTFSSFITKVTLDKITTEDITLLAYCMANLYTIFGRNADQFIFKAINFRNILRILANYKELIIKQSKFQQFLKSLIKDNFLPKVSSERSSEIYQTVYEYMEKLLER